jgi:hypothetical protein
MKWLCGCDKEATRMEVLWYPSSGRLVSYSCRIGCEKCVPCREDEKGRLQYFDVALSASTKQTLVLQVVAQVLKTRPKPRGYLPKTDIQGALRSVHKSAD